jgi:hypothetical protein
MLGASPLDVPPASRCPVEHRISTAIVARQPDRVMLLLPVPLWTRTRTCTCQHE